MFQHELLTTDYGPRTTDFRHDAGFVAHHSCGTVAASHRLPRTAIQIGKQQTCYSNHISVLKHLRSHTLKSVVSDFLRMSVTRGDPLAGFSSTTRFVSNTLRSSDSVMTS